MACLARLCGGRAAHQRLPDESLALGFLGGHGRCGLWGGQCGAGSGLPRGQLGEQRPQQPQLGLSHQLVVGTLALPAHELLQGRETRGVRDRLGPIAQRAHVCGGGGGARGRAWAGLGLGWGRGCGARGRAGWGAGLGLGRSWGWGWAGRRRVRPFAFIRPTANSRLHVHDAWSWVSFLLRARQRPWYHSPHLSQPIMKPPWIRRCVVTDRGYMSASFDVPQPQREPIHPFIAVPWCAPLAQLPVSRSLKSWFVRQVGGRCSRGRLAPSCCRTPRETCRRPVRRR